MNCCQATSISLNIPYFPQNTIIWLWKVFCFVFFPRRHSYLTCLCRLVQFNVLRVDVERFQGALCLRMAHRTLYSLYFLGVARVTAIVSFCGIQTSVRLLCGVTIANMLEERIGLRTTGSYKRVLSRTESSEKQIPASAKERHADVRRSRRASAFIATFSNSRITCVRDVGISRRQGNEG